MKAFIDSSGKRVKKIDMKYIQFLRIHSTVFVTIKKIERKINAFMKNYYLVMKGSENKYRYLFINLFFLIICDRVL